MNLLAKLFISPLILYITDILSPQINFSNFWQIIVLGWVMALVSSMGDIILLERISVITVTWLDIAIFSLIIWLSSLFFTNSHILFSGSLFSGIILGFSEYINHKYILALRGRQTI